MPDDTTYRYDAFISYRHVDPDRGWAKWLHQAIETYRVPKQVAAQPGVRPLLRRVFRDEEELPVSSNLSREIDEALEQSRYLIVICSPKTPESSWCCAEIERFRELGRDDQILALLVEGEPTESFPLPLRQKKRTSTDADGTQREVVEAVEPLAADVRPSRTESQRSLKRAARLRFVACMLGCRYDDLRQREQVRQNRRKTMAVTVLAGLLAVMSTLAVFAVIQANRARAAERVAMQQRDVALDTLNALIVEAYDKLQDRPGARQLQDALLELALDKLKSVNLDLEAGGGVADRSVAVGLRRRGRLFLLAGRTDAAADLLGRSRDILDALATQAPDDTQVQLDLARTSHLMGDLSRRQGQTRQAEANYRTALEIRHALAADAPGDMDLQRELAESYEYVGDAKQALGDTEAAASHYRKSLDVLTLVVERRPEDDKAKRLLADAHTKVGDITRLKGNLTSAQEHYQQAMEVFAAVAEGDVYNTRAQRNLAVAYNKLGSVSRQLNELGAARSQYERSLELTAALAASDRGNLEWQRELALCYTNLGFISLRMGEGDAGLDYYKRALAISQDLAAADPSNTQLQRNLADAYQLLGDARRQLREPLAALDNYEASLAIREQLVRDDVHNSALQRDLAGAYELLGRLHSQKPKADAARRYYQQAMDLRRKLFEADPANAQLQRDLSNAQLRMSSLLVGEAKIELIRESLDMRKQLAALDPEAPQPQVALASAYHLLGIALAQHRQLREAIEPLTQAESSFAALATRFKDDPQSLNRVLTSRKALVGVHQALGDWAAAAAIQQKVATTRAALLQLQMDDLGTYLAWVSEVVSLGDLHRRAGAVSAARIAYQQAKQATLKLDEQGPAAAQRTQWLEQIDKRLAALPEAVQ